MICFFNDTATTDIYTYGHTLSLHDALPIFARADRGRGREHLFHQQMPQPVLLPRRIDRDRADHHQRPGAAVVARKRHRPALDRPEERAILDEREAQRRDRRRAVAHLIGGSRSEEHTSEIQSLMRISYAVFCSKKTKKSIHY